MYYIINTQVFTNKRIHENLTNLLEYGQDIELRIPLIPNVSDTEENLVRPDTIYISAKKDTIRNFTSI